jgi:hypothetical protein
LKKSTLSDTIGIILTVNTYDVKLIFEVDARIVKSVAVLETVQVGVVAKYAVEAEHVTVLGITGNMERGKVTDIFSIK